MPAPVSSTVPKSTIDKPSSHPRKKRTLGRRARVKLGEDSDEEIEREVTSDDDDTDDDQSSVESESEAESFSDDVHPNARSEVVTPSTTQSPPPPELDGRTPLSNGILSKHSDAGPFAAGTDWADMVTAEHANGAEELPVIDFADLDRHRIDQQFVPAPRSRKARKETKNLHANRSTSAPPASPPVRSSEQVVEIDDLPAEEPVASTSDATNELYSNRSRGQSARQAYQQRLETDPSFVPKVGEFWGHDDRLLDKDLRSLSGWWRGRWQSRGRGRGAFNMRGRGGRGFYGGGHTSAQGVEEAQDTEGGAIASPEEVPPVERAWTHDGFEEMKRRDERRREQQRARDQNNEHDQPLPLPQQVRFGPQRGFGFRGRGGFFAGRGRGGFASPSGLHQGSPNLGRPWFAMKPERIWTKQHEAFLFFDPSLKPRPGQGPGFRVKFPGGPDTVVRTQSRSWQISRVGFASSAETSQDDGDKLFTVRIPRRAGKEKAAEETTSPPPVPSIASEEAPTTIAELSIEEVFTVRPNIVPNRRIEIPLKPPTVNGASHAASSSLSVHAPSSASSSSAVDETAQRIDKLSLEPPLLRQNDSSPSPIIKENVLRRPSLSTDNPSIPHPQSEEAQRPAPPTLHPLQTTFSPAPQTPPSYGSPYAYGPALPPGIGMSHHGMPYELATGRPVYLHQQTPPPMFTPRPMMHVPHPSASVPFVPAHMHHHSVGSPDFISHPHTPPVGTFVDPSTGVPIFAPARQSSRIEIRAPNDATDGKKSFSRPSGLRTTMSNSEAYSNMNESSEPLAAPVDDGLSYAVQSVEQAQVAEPTMAYPAYQQQYYYPEAYGYPPYMDMSPQVMQYDMYAPADHRTPQPPMIYY